MNDSNLQWVSKKYSFLDSKIHHLDFFHDLLEHIIAGSYVLLFFDITHFEGRSIVLHSWQEFSAKATFEATFKPTVNQY